MNKTLISEKLKKLEEVKRKLKSEYIGIDSQIDQLINFVTPWYCTPEILDRPALVFLAGMTGNGKTSVVRRLLACLEIKKQLYFDCGEESASNNNYRLSSKLSEVLDTERDFKCGSNPFEDESDENQDNGRDIAFVFDEFQYCRSIDEEGKEVDKGNIRAIWNLIDSGIIDDCSSNRRRDEFNRNVDCLKELDKAFPDLILNKLNLTNHLDEIKDDHFWHIIRGWYYDPEEEKSYKVFDPDNLTWLKRVLDSKEIGLGRKVLNELNKATKLSELISIIDGYDKLLNKPKIFNCSKSIIFILGNIDEAFEIHNNLSPDIDADIFKESTNKVNVTTIKNALKRRVRIEQLSRLGNNMIIYPSLGSKEFKEIIVKELEKIVNKVSPYYKLTYSNKIVKLIYSESVYPAQGVRPTISSVYSMITPRLSNILIKLSSISEVDTVNLDVKEDNFETSKATIIINYLKNDNSIIDSEEFEIPLTLGPLRDISKDKLINLKAIHEASHAVVYSYMTGRVPSSIIGLTSDGGGVMTLDKQNIKDGIYSFHEIDSSIMTSLAGYCGEHIFFNNEQCTIGSSSDINKAWRTFSEAVYEEGYFTPIRLDKDPRSGDRPYGLSDRLKIIFENLDRSKIECSTIENAAKDRFLELINKTDTILKNEKTLVGQIGLYISKNRTMNGEIFLEYIDKYGKTFNQKSMKETIEKFEDYTIKF